MSVSPQQKDLAWQRTELISVPSLEYERRMLMRRSDWERCKKRLSKMKEPAPRLHLVYSFLFGISATSLFSIIAVITSSLEVPSWLTPTYICIFLFSLASAVVFVCTDKSIRKKTQSDIGEILEDMDSIEKAFGS